MRWNAGADRDRADVNVTVIDVPAFVGGFQIAAAGKLGHDVNQSATRCRKATGPPKEMAPAQGIGAGAIGARTPG